MKISSKIKEYNVEFIDSAIRYCEFFSLPHRFIVADRTVYNLHRERVFDSLSPEEIYFIDACEEAKVIDTALALCEKLTLLPSKRNTTLISFGGGIIQDITGFAASILYRGINWIYIPTTLLAQGDSCIGSKTSLNFHSYKNLLGTFYPPNQIFIDLDFIDTLADKDYRSGLGEIIKLHLLSGEENGKMLNNGFEDLIDKKEDSLKSFIESSHKIKKYFIECDEFDLGVRRCLNFGHTFGHALESLTDFRIPHGQAVLIGIILANAIANKRGLLSNKLQKDSESFCLRVIDELPTKECFELDRIVPLLKKDKKNVDDKLFFILLNSSFTALPIRDVTLHEIAYALDYTKNLFSRTLRRML